MCAWNSYTKDGALAGTLQFQCSVNIGDTAAYPGQTDPGRGFADLEIFHYRSGNSFTVIADRHDDGTRGGSDHYFRPVAAGMAVNIGEPFLQNAE